MDDLFEHSLLSLYISFLAIWVFSNFQFKPFNFLSSLLVWLLLQKSHGVIAGQKSASLCRWQHLLKTVDGNLIVAVVASYCLGTISRLWGEYKLKRKNNIIWGSSWFKSLTRCVTELCFLFKCKKKKDSCDTFQKSFFSFLAPPFCSTVEGGQNWVCCLQAVITGLEQIRGRDRRTTEK